MCAPAWEEEIHNPDTFWLLVSKSSCHNFVKHFFAPNQQVLFTGRRDARFMKALPSLQTLNNILSFVSHFSRGMQLKYRQFFRLLGKLTATKAVNKSSASAAVIFSLNPRRQDSRVVEISNHSLWSLKPWKNIKTASSFCQNQLLQEAKIHWHVKQVGTASWTDCYSGLT